MTADTARRGTAAALAAGLALLAAASGGCDPAGPAARSDPPARVRATAAAATAIAAASTPSTAARPEAPVAERRCGWPGVGDLGPRSPALVRAVGAGDVAAARRLLDRGSDPDVVDRYLSTTPLAAAAQATCREAVALLLERGADPDLVAPGGEAPLSFAVNVGDPAVVDLLLRAGADPARTGGHGTVTPLHEAVGVGRPSILARLLPYTKRVDVGLDPTSNPLAGRQSASASPLEFVAGLPGSIHLVRMLLAAGAEPTLTALFQAVRVGDEAMVAALLDAGAPRSTSPAETTTLADVARDAGHPGIARLVE